MANYLASKANSLIWRPKLSLRIILAIRLVVLLPVALFLMFLSNTHVLSLLFLVVFLLHASLSPLLLHKALRTWSSFKPIIIGLDIAIIAIAILVVRDVFPQFYFYAIISTATSALAAVSPKEYALESYRLSDSSVLDQNKVIEVYQDSSGALKVYSARTKVIASFANVLDTFYEKIYRQASTRKLSSLFKLSGQMYSKRLPEKIISLAAEHTKKFYDSKKVIVWLARSGSNINKSSMIVRGRRDELPERAWKEDLEKLAKTILQEKKPARIQNYQIAGKKDIPTRPLFVFGAPLLSDGKIKGVMVTMTSRRYRRNDILNLNILGRITGKAIDAAKREQLQKKTAALEERHHIAMDLHDGLAQALFGISVNLVVCQKLIDKNPQEVQKRLSELQKLSMETLKDTRKYIFQLRPDGSMNHTLPKLIRRCSRSFKKNHDINIRSSIRGKPATDIPLYIKQNLYRILQESLANIAKHSQASQARVTLTSTDHECELVIEDNGMGFLVKDAYEINSDSCMGLVNMKKRAEIIDGSFTLDSLPGRGTVVRVRVATNGELHEN